MDAPLDRVLTLVRGMMAANRSEARFGDAEGTEVEPTTIGVNDPARARRLAALAAETGGEVEYG